MKHKSFQDIQEEIIKMRQSGMTLRVIADHYPGVSFGTIGRILEGIEPKTPEVRHALGMIVYHPAAVCPVHNVVHIGRCPREPRYKKLSDMPPEVLKWKFENREQVK